MILLIFSVARVSSVFICSSVTLSHFLFFFLNLFQTSRFRIRTKRVSSEPKDKVLHLSLFDGTNIVTKQYSRFVSWVLISRIFSTIFVKGNLQAWVGHRKQTQEGPYPVCDRDVTTHELDNNTSRKSVTGGPADRVPEAR